MNTQNPAITDAEIRAQLALCEDSLWEFKQVEFRGNHPVSPKRDDLADELAAFANAAGGFMLLGVSNAGEVQQMSREQLQALEKLVSKLSFESIEPPIDIYTHLKLWEGNRPFLLVKIPAGDAAHTSPGGQFSRMGNAKRKISEEEWLCLKQMRPRTKFCWFDEQTVADTGPASLEKALWTPLLSADDLATPDASLEKMRLLARDDRGVLRATVAGVLLCTEHPEEWLPNAVIAAARYRGRDQASGQWDAQEIVGPIHKQVEQAFRFVMRNMRVAEHKIPGRADVPQYSARAVFEALVNAVVHRDYSIRGSRIRLLMFEDRLEIRSPGGLPNALTVDDMAERQPTRNEMLAFAFGRLSTVGLVVPGERQFFMERRGVGVPVILKETEAASGKLPEFRLLGDAELCLTLPAVSPESSSARVIITVHSQGRPMSGVDLLAIFPNKTWKWAATDRKGVGELDLYSTHLPMTLFAAASGCAAYMERDWVPAERSLALEMTPLKKGGSVIFPEASGQVPGLRGRLNPIRDNQDRTYLYAGNIAINDGQQQPVHFMPGEDLLLTDAYGKERVVRIIDMLNQNRNVLIFQNRNVLFGASYITWITRLN